MYQMRHEKVYQLFSTCGVTGIKKPLRMHQEGIKSKKRKHKISGKEP
jgi:hypothetical protein